MLSSRDEGHQRLQQLADSLAMVLSGTSLAGKEMLAETAQKQRRDWDDLVTNMINTKSRLETTVALWTTFADARDKMSRWLDHSETQLTEATQSAAGSTLAERHSHAEKLRVRYSLFLLLRLKLFDRVLK